MNCLTISKDSAKTNFMIEQFFLEKKKVLLIFEEMISISYQRHGQCPPADRVLFWVVDYTEVTFSKALTDCISQIRPVS